MGAAMELMRMQWRLMRDVGHKRWSSVVGCKVSAFRSNRIRFEGYTSWTTLSCGFSNGKSFMDSQTGCAVPRPIDALTVQQLQQVDQFVDILLKVNSEQFNLTAVTERTEVMERHVNDSLALLPVIEAAYTEKYSNSSPVQLNVVDVGSGAGLPGIILAIARPDWQVTLLDSTEKRCNFLKLVSDVATLENVDVVNSRAEDAGRSTLYREVFDVAVARAVAEMRVLVELCLPLVRVGGFLVAAKGANPQSEVDGAQQAVSLLGGRVLSLCTVQSSSPNGLRTAVVCLKDRCTPSKYPRRAGTPQKRPL